jgi:hypothetical protein
MSTNANVFNSRVTSEALEAKYRQVFPAQAGAELIQDLYASGVIQPVIDFSSVAEGSVLSANLQTAWDFATSHTTWNDGQSGTLINNTGFWQVDVSCYAEANATANGFVATISLSDGLSTKIIWSQPYNASATADQTAITTNEQKFVVFLRSGDSLTYAAPLAINSQTSAWYRQIADVNGNLVNPLGFTFS